jgi:hypothetical protein
MTEHATAGIPGAPAPRIAPLLVVYTVARLVIAAVLVAVVWFAGLPGIPALAFGVLLQLPVSYLALRSIRERLTEALAARGAARRAARARLRGSGDTAEE